MAQEEEGCLHYQLYREAGEAGEEEATYAMIETWVCQEDLTRCIQAPPLLKPHSSYLIP